MSRTQRLAQRRAMLLAECALQRALLVAQTQQLGLSTGLIRSEGGWLNRLKQIPGWAGLLITVVMIFIPGKVATLTRGGLMLMQLLRALRKEAPER